MDDTNSQLDILSPDTGRARSTRGPLTLLALVIGLPALCVGLGLLLFFDVPHRWQTRRDLDGLYKAAGQGDRETVRRYVSDARETDLAWFIARAKTTHGPAVGVEVLYDDAAEFGQYSVFLYRVRYQDGTEEHNAITAWRGQPLPVPRPTVEQRVRDKYAGDRTISRIEFGQPKPPRSLGPWGVPYTIVYTNGARRAEIAPVN